MNLPSSEPTYADLLTRGNMQVYIVKYRFATERQFNQSALVATSKYKTHIPGTRKAYPMETGTPLKTICPWVGQLVGGSNTSSSPSSALVRSTRASILATASIDVSRTLQLPMNDLILSLSDTTFTRATAMVPTELLPLNPTAAPTRAVATTAIEKSRTKLSQR